MARRRSGALLVATALAVSGAACSPLGELPADQVAPTSTSSRPPTPTPTPPTIATPSTTGAVGDIDDGDAGAGQERWERCVNEAGGWWAEYPPGWHTTTGEGVEPCRLFDPDPIELAAEPSDVPASVAVHLRSEDVAVPQQLGQDAAVEIVDRRQVRADGYPGERLEERHTGDGSYPAGTRSVRYVIDLGGRALVASTFDVDTADFGARVQVLDQLVARLQLAEPEPDAVRAALPEDTVALFFTPEPGGNEDCTAIRPVRRPARWPTVLRSAIEALLLGPTAQERQAGLTSPFSSTTAGALRSVSVDDAVARVDLADLSVDMAGSTDCERAALFAQLDATVTQFPEVDRAVYSLDGDVERFYRWLGVPPPPSG